MAQEPAGAEQHEPREGDHLTSASHDLDPDAVATRTQLGRLLTDLRRHSGKSLRCLAREADSSASTLSGWCRAENLPFPAQDGVFARMIGACGVDNPEPWLQALRRVRDGETPAPQTDGPAPYRGLNRFEPDDACYFFGHEDAVTAVRHALDRTPEGVCAVVGASGSGKSSLLRAGVVPVLEAQGMECVIITPGAGPSAALTRLTGGEEARVTETPTTDAEKQPPRALIVDQLEELFTECADADQRCPFAERLRTLAVERGWTVVLGLRIDFYAHAAALPWLSEPLSGSQVLLGPRSRDQLTRAIVEPARAVGGVVDDELVERLLEDLVPLGSPKEGRSGVLPLLSHALLETWRRARGGRMTLADYQAVGGIAGAVERSAERVVDELSADQLELARQVLLRLVSVDHESVVTRRLVPYRELKGLTTAYPHAAGADARLDEPDTQSVDTQRADTDPAGTADDAEDRAFSGVLDQFISARLLTADRDTVAIAHDALLHAWPRLRRWIANDREALHVHHQITEAARLWREADRDPSMLASGGRLELMRSWASSPSHRLRLNADERTFLDRSVAREAAEAAEAARRSRRLRALATAASTLALLAGALGVVAALLRDEAVDARDEALSRQIAATVHDVRGDDPAVATDLAAAGYRIAPTIHAVGALLEVARPPVVARYAGDDGPTALAVAEQAELAAVGADASGAVQLWTGPPGDLTAAGEVPLDDAELDTFALALDPAGETLAVGDTRGLVTLWDVTDPDDPAARGEALEGLDGPVQDLTFDPEAAEIAVVGDGPGVLRWDVTDPDAPDPLPTVEWEAITWSVTYGPDGQVLAFGEDGGDVQLAARTSEVFERVAAVDVDDRAVLSVALADDGATLAAGARGGTATLVDLDAGLDAAAAADAVTDLGDADAPVELDDEAHRELEEADFDSWVNTVRFSPDGSLLVAGASDGVARAWDVEDGAVAGEVAHPAPVTHARFDGHGQSLVTVANDGAARAWDRHAHFDRRTPGRIFSLAFTDDGRRMAAFSGHGTDLRQVDGDRTERQARVGPPDDGSELSGAGDLSGDGELLAHGLLDGQAMLHTVAADGNVEPVGSPFGEATGLVHGVAFSPDHTLLAVAGEGHDVRLWDVTDPADPERFALLDEPPEVVLDVAWSAGGAQLAAAGADGRAHLYDMSEPGQPELTETLAVPDGEAFSVAFAGDDDMLAVGGGDGSVSLWDTSDVTEPRRLAEPLVGPVGQAYAVAFARDDATLAAAITDGSTWLWDLSEPEAPARHARLGSADEPMYATAFSPAADLVTAGGAAGQLQLWPIDADQAAEAVCARGGSPLSAEDWRRYLPETPFAEPCP